MKRRSIGKARTASPESKRGRELIDHQKMGIAVHLFIREGKLAGNRAAPFTYHGEVTYVRHKGSEPMSIEWEMVR